MASSNSSCLPVDMPVVIAVPKPNNPHYVAHDMINEKDFCTNEEFNISKMRQMCPNPHYIVDLMIQEERYKADDEFVINHGSDELSLENKQKKKHIKKTIIEDDGYEADIDMRYHEYILINIKNRNRKKVANKLMVKSILKNSMKDEGYEGDDDEKALV